MMTVIIKTIKTNIYTSTYSLWSIKSSLINAEIIPPSLRHCFNEIVVSVFTKYHTTRIRVPHRVEIII